MDKKILSSKAQGMHAYREMGIWIYTDADNTLWDTNAVFANAQLHLLEYAEHLAGVRAPSSERLSYLRGYDQAIAKRHHALLRYPPALLLRALTLGLRGASLESAVSRVIAEGAIPSGDEEVGLTAYRNGLSRAPDLLRGVPEGLALAHGLKIPIYVITEGPAEITNGRLRDLGIAEYVDGVLSASKSVELYSRLAERAAPKVATMIGDQPDRDVLLPHNAGMQAVLVKSQFRPEWLGDNDETHADAIVGDYLAAVRWVVDQSIIRIGVSIANE
jgi:putative hydrolase of the HAD superfamily